MGQINPKKLEERAMTALIIGPVCLGIVYWGGPLFYLLMALCLCISMYEAFKLMMRLPPQILYVPAGFTYIIFCFSCFITLASFSPLFPFLLILMVAASDIGAYFFGKLIGGPKMWVAVSPNKTWAGLVGAALSPMIVYLCWFGFTEPPETLAGYLELAIFGALIGLAGQAGDLLISYFKRKAEVKDTGNILPGHGGLLDRIDALMLSAPVFLLAKIVA